MNDKRIYHRLLLETDIEQRELANFAISTGTTRNISMGGVCITTEGDPLSMGHVYRFRFTIPGGLEELEVNGRVVWTREQRSGITVLFDNGIEFIDPDDEFLHVIEDFSIGAVAAD
jgi:hypothetical protein